VLVLKSSLIGPGACSICTEFGDLNDLLAQQLVVLAQSGSGGPHFLEAVTLAQAVSINFFARVD
jgi:hypothetical protein